MSTETILIQDSQFGSFAKIAPRSGFNCFEFETPAGRETIKVIDSHPDFEKGESRPSANGIPLLFPFPNRIQNGQFEWNDQTWELPPEKTNYDANGNAIHGFCLDRPWRIIQQDDSSVTGQFQLSQDSPERVSYWPADFILEIKYSLKGSTLRADIEITNPDQVPLPWGFGTHPYFTLPLGSQSSPGETLVYVPAGKEWVLTDCLPSGETTEISPEKDLREGARFDQLKLDDVLTDLTSGDHGQIECSLVDQEAGLQIIQRCDTGFREMVVFTPPGRNAICIEPYTCVTDAINLEKQGVETGWQILPPGEKYTCWIEIQASAVLA